METHGEQIDNWPDWIRWIMKYYDCSAAEISRQLECDHTYISQIKTGKRLPSQAYAVLLSSYAVDRGPRPPEMELTSPIKFLVGDDDDEGTGA